MIDTRSIAIATTTFYPYWRLGQENNKFKVEKIRGNLAIEMLKNAKKENFQVVLIDGGSSLEFQAEIVKLGIQIYKQVESGMSASRRQAFQKAAELSRVKVICWTEPEKVSYISKYLTKVLIPIFEGKADIVVPSRTAYSFQTYPSYQVYFEKKGNRLLNKILRDRGLLSTEDKDLDIWFGPKVFKNDKRVVDLFLEKFVSQNNNGLNGSMSPDLWANTMVFPIVRALYKNFRVVGISVPYIHPSEQTAVEIDQPMMVKKRQLQLKNVILNTKNYLQKILPDSGRVLKKII